MKLILLTFIFVGAILSTAPTLATKLAPQSLQELTKSASLVAIVHISKSDISSFTYEKAHSDQKRYLIYFEASVSELIIGKTGTKTIKFLSREPLLVDRDYLVILESSESNNLFVSQAGYAAFEKTYISFDSGIKEGIRVPTNYVSVPAPLSYTIGVTKINEYSVYKWLDWHETKNWLLSNLAAQNMK